METDGTGGSSEGSGNEGPRVRLPLNSKRLKRSQLERLAKALDLPTSASSDELRQLIDGKLTDQGKEARNVQVDATRLPGSRWRTKRASSSRFRQTLMGEVQVTRGGRQLRNQTAVVRLGDLRSQRL